MIRRLARYTYPFSDRQDQMHENTSCHDHHHAIHDFVFGPHHHRHHHHHHHNANASDRNPRYNIDTFLANQIREWDDVKDGIAHAFDQFNYAVAEKKRDREEKEKEKEKAKKEKDSAVKKEEEKTKRLAKKMRAFEAEQRAQRKKQEARQDQLQDKVHALAEHALASATTAVDRTVAEQSPYRGRRSYRGGDADDDIERLDHLTRVIGHLDLAIKPQPTQICGINNSVVPQIPSGNLSLSTLQNGYCHACLMNQGIFTTNHSGTHYPDYYSWSGNRKPATVIGNEEHLPPIVIQNNNRGAKVDVEESRSVSGHRTRGSHDALARHVWIKSEEDSDAESVDTVTVRDARGGYVHTHHIGYGHDHDHGLHAGYPYGRRQHHRHPSPAFDSIPRWRRMFYD